LPVTLARKSVSIDAHMPAWSPAGNYYVAELRLTEGSEHFASLAEVSRLQGFLSRPGVSSALPLLAGPISAIPLVLSAGYISAKYRRMADQLHVRAISIDPANPDGSARSVLERLQEIEREVAAG
jgi:hypothetical protein